MDFVIVRRT